MGALFSRLRSRNKSSSENANTTQNGKRASIISSEALSERDRAMLELKRQNDRLVQYSLSVQKVIDRELELAREFIRSNQKQKATFCLRKKKYQETLLTRTQNSIWNVEQLINSIEFAEVSAQVFAALKTGNEVLAALNKEMSVEDVEQLMDDTSEAVENQNRISEMLGGELTKDDDNDVLNQLEAMEVELNLQNIDELKPNPTVEIKPIHEDATVPSETETTAAPTPNESKAEVLAAEKPKELALA